MLARFGFDRLRSDPQDSILSVAKRCIEGCGSVMPPSAALRRLTMLARFGFDRLRSDSQDSILSISLPPHL
jgi:hypothetical protein